MTVNLQTFATPPLATGVMAGLTNAAVATATSGTIATAGVYITRSIPAAAITAVVLQAGTVDGQVVIIENDGLAASTITFAAAATSNVANGVSTVIAGLTSVMYIWNGTTLLWYPVV